MRKKIRRIHIRSHMSLVQQEYERVMFHGEYHNEFDRLKALAESYKAGRITSAVYVHGLFWLFADDGGLDWLDDIPSLMKLTNAVIEGGKNLDKPVTNAG